jgi:hypothetical protein
MAFTTVCFENRHDVMDEQATSPTYLKYLCLPFPP